MKTNLKMFDVFFDFGDRLIRVSIDAESTIDLLEELEYGLFQAKNSKHLFIFEDFLVNPEALKAVQVKELSEEE